jgi:hypothetical protein
MYSVINLSEMSENVVLLDRQKKSRRASSTSLKFDLNETADV